MYARVSTADQQTISMQVAAMREYAQRRGWTVVACIEDIRSGVKERPKRKELEGLAKRREIDGILVWRLDRWGRSLIDLISSIQDLDAIGVGLISVTENLDMTTPTGRAMIGMVAVFAQFERDLLRARVIAGMAEAKKNGKHCGRPAKARAKYDLVKRLFSDGNSADEIVEKLGIGRGSVYRALKAA
jgi:DNA invertase Pin-like site-specific DNA recombinase